MQFSQMKYAVLLSKMNSFGKAAEKLHISQSTLSQQIQTLEKSIGVKLFVRNRNGVYLTDAGEEFVSKGEAILNSVESLEKAMKEYANQEKGKVSIGLFWTFGSLGIIEGIHEFSALHEQIDLPLEIGGSLSLIEKVRNREITGAFIVKSGNEPFPEEIQATKIMQSDLSLLIPKNNPLSRKQILTYADLDGQELLMVDKWSTMYETVSNRIIESGAKPHIIANSSQADVVASCVNNGMCCGFLTEPVAKKYMSDAAVIRPIEPKVERSIYYITLKSAMDVWASKLFYDYVNERFKDQR